MDMNLKMMIRKLKNEFFFFNKKKRKLKFTFINFLVSLKVFMISFVLF